MVAVNYLWNPINDNIVREFDDGGATVAEYTTEPDLYGNVVSQYRDGQTSYLHFDGQRNMTELTSDAGIVTDAIRYSAFGEVSDHAGSTTSPFRYVGQLGYYGDNPGCYSVRRRQLKSVIARWLSTDPVGAYASSCERHALGPYSYCASNPTQCVDPSGLAASSFALPSEPLPQEWRDWYERMRRWELFMDFWHRVDDVLRRCGPFPCGRIAFNVNAIRVTLELGSIGQCPFAGRFRFAAQLMKGIFDNVLIPLGECPPLCVCTITRTRFTWPVSLHIPFIEWYWYVIALPRPRISPRPQPGYAGPCIVFGAMYIAGTIDVEEGTCTIIPRPAPPPPK